MQTSQNKPGTVLTGVILLLIVCLGILSAARHFWLDSANEHFDKFVSAYIAEDPNFTPDDLPDLKARLLEGSIFIKIHRWDKTTFIKDRQLYNQMKVTIDQAKMKRDKNKKSTMEIMINL